MSFIIFGATPIMFLATLLSILAPTEAHCYSHPEMLLQPTVRQLSLARVGLTLRVAINKSYPQGCSHPLNISQGVTLSLVGILSWFYIDPLHATIRTFLQPHLLITRLGPTAVPARWRDPGPNSAIKYHSVQLT
jgi:hypothetical protein